LETLLRGGANLNSRHPLRLNVGFLLNKNVGDGRSFDFDHASLRVGEDLDIQNLRGSVHMTRTGQGVYANGQLQAKIQLDCVRCLTTFDQALRFKLDDLFSYPPEKASDRTLSVSMNGILDLNPLFREYLLLDIPLQPVCQQDCKGLCAECGLNLNEGECDHPLTDVDPRLEVLKTLRTKS
jgi:uncharacterized protein